MYSPHSAKLYVGINAGIPQSISYIMKSDEKSCVSHQVMCKTYVFCFIFRAHGFKSIKTSMPLMPSLFKSLEYILDPPNLIQIFWKKPMQGLTKIKVTLFFSSFLYQKCLGNWVLAKSLEYILRDFALLQRLTRDDVLCWCLYITHAQVSSSVCLLRKRKTKERKRGREREKGRKWEKKKDKERRKDREAKYFWSLKYLFYNNLVLLEGWAQGQQ